MSPDELEDLLGRSLAGQRGAMGLLVRQLLPVVQAEVGYAFMRSPKTRGRNPREAVRDMVQDIFAMLLADDAKTLRSWDPARGHGLPGFVRLVARRAVYRALGSRRRDPFGETSETHEELERRAVASGGVGAFGGPSPVLERLEQRQRLELLWQALEDRLDERGRTLFRMLYIDEREVSEVCAALDMTRDAIYAWRTRLRKIVRSLDPQERGASEIRALSAMEPRHEQHA